MRRSSTEKTARSLLRIDRLDVIQFGCNLRQELVLVAQPFGLARRMVPLVIIEPANQNWQLGCELSCLVDREPVAQSMQHGREHTICPVTIRPVTSMISLSQALVVCTVLSKTSSPVVLTIFPLVALTHDG
jgi:hypothetical protein